MSVDKTWAIDFASGWCSGAAGILVTQPLDGILVRLQAHGAGSGEIIKDIGKNGAKGFWRGSSLMMGIVPLQNALLFAGYGAGVKWSGGVSAANGEPAPLWPIFVGGCVGGLAQSFLVSPVELIKVQLQLATANSASTSAAAAAGELSAMTIVSRLSQQATSYRWFGRGLSATLARDVIPHGVWYASYEGAKRTLGKWEAQKKGGGEIDRLSNTSQVAAGAFAATVAWVVGYPADVIKTRLQATGATENGFISTTKSMYNQGGVAIFWRGLGLKLTRAIPMSAIGFWVYEEVFEILTQRFS